MSQANVQAMRRLYDAFNSGDLDTFEQGVGRDIVWNEADNSLYAGGNPYRSFAADGARGRMPVERAPALVYRVVASLIENGPDTPRNQPCSPP